MDQKVDQKVYHGTIKVEDFARSLISRFNRGNLMVQQIGRGKQIAVQIASRSSASSGGQTAISVSLQQVEDGVIVKVGKQAWLGVAASLGFTALTALRNPISLLNRLDDLAQDIEYLQLTDEVWNVIDSSARVLGAGHELSERLRRLVCAYCDTANPVGESNCIACGAPLGSSQPKTCPKCGFANGPTSITCSNCGSRI